MMATGIVRRVDDLGRICLPKELRRKAGIKECAVLEISIDGDNIILTPYKTTIDRYMDKEESFRQRYGINLTELFGEHPVDEITEPAEFKNRLNQFYELISDLEAVKREFEKVVKEELDK